MGASRKVDHANYPGKMAYVLEIRRKVDHANYPGKMAYLQKLQHLIWWSSSLEFVHFLRRLLPRQQLTAALTRTFL